VADVEPVTDTDELALEERVGLLLPDAEDDADEEPDVEDVGEGDVDGDSTLEALWLGDELPDTVELCEAEEDGDELFDDDDEPDAE
jgi:hypothetical protein